MTVYVDIHAIQPVGPSNLNRDLSGSPKTATYGGVRRARVSSQSWKRPMRLAFREKYSPDNLGIRTKRIVELLADQIKEIDPSLEDEAVQIAAETFPIAGIKIPKPKVAKGEVPKAADYTSGYLVFVSQFQIENLAHIAVEAFQEGGTTALKTRRRDLKAALKRDLSVDLALFGRMIADDADLNVDASCQVAHALSTHQVGTEFDFFTAVDDVKQASEETDAGAGMMGTVEFNSATLYRYATVNATALAEQLGSDEAASKAIGGFVDVFATSLPTGKQNTFAAQTLPEALIVSVRTDRPMSRVGAFERPVYPQKHPDAPVVGYTEESVQRLVDYGNELDGVFGGGQVQELAVAVGEAGAVLRAGLPDGVVYDSLDSLCTAVTEVVSGELESK